MKILPPTTTTDLELGNLARAAIALRHATAAALAAEQAPARKRRLPPPGISPQGLSRLEAAAFIGIGATTFDAAVQAGQLPPPRRFGRRAIWDRDALAAALAGAIAPKAANGAAEPNSMG